MGRVMVFDNPLADVPARVCAHTGPLIDWLLAEYPHGFPGPAVMTHNCRTLMPQDYDVPVADGDLVTLHIMPTGGVVAAVLPYVIKAVIYAVVATGVSYIANALFGSKAALPAAPSSVSTQPGPPGSVYNLSLPTNTAKLGQPIPAAYGRNILVPDQAMTPFSYYRDNKQYICQLLCLGMGEYDLADLVVRIADNPVDQMAAGVVDYQIYGPGEHRKQFDVIAPDFRARYGGWFFENVYTSPEVADQEIYTDSVAGGKKATGQAWNGAWEGYVGGIFFLDFPVLDYADAKHFDGRKVWVEVVSGPGAGFVAEVGYIVYSGQSEDDPQEIGRKGHLANGESWPFGSGGVELRFTYFDPATAAGDGAAVIGPYAAVPPCWVTRRLLYDVVFPNGLYKYDDTGSFKEDKVVLSFVAEVIDNAGQPTGRAEQLTWKISRAENTPMRFTIEHEVPEARYRVHVKRTTPKEYNAAAQSTVYWTGLRSTLGPWCDVYDEHYGEVTLLAIRIKATEGLASNAANLVRVQATRALDGAASRSPIDAYRDIYTNVWYGAARPAAEVDETALTAVAGEVSGCHFDAVFDTASTVWEALQLSVQLIRGIPAMRGSLISLVRDKAHCVPVAGFNMDNMRELRLSYRFDTTADYEGIEGEFINPVDGSKNYSRWPLEATIVERVALWGCTNAGRAQCVVRQLWNQRKYRRRVATFVTELDAHALSLGDPVNLEHELLGTGAVMHVISAIEPRDELTVQVEAFRYQPEVYV